MNTTKIAAPSPIPTSAIARGIHATGAIGAIVCTIGRPTMRAAGVAARRTPTRMAAPTPSTNPAVTRNNVSTIASA
jgi:hypothetical protein